MAERPRQSQRVNAEVPVRLENRVAGVTRDISPTDVYFTISDKLETGQEIRFSIEFGDPSGGVLCLECLGKVVRVEESPGKCGVAATIIESRLERRSAQAFRKEESPAK